MVKRQQTALFDDIVERTDRLREEDPENELVRIADLYIREGKFDEIIDRFGSDEDGDETLLAFLSAIEDELGLGCTEDEDSVEPARTLELT